MKKTFLLTIVALCGFGAFAQDNAAKAAASAAQAIAESPAEKVPEVKPSYWTKSASINLGFSNTQFNSWAAGGENSVQFSGALDTKANYAKGLMAWTNRLQLDYGFLFSEDKQGLMQKTNDVIYLQSKWSYRASANSALSYSASFDFKSQFDDVLNNYKQVEGKWTGDLKSTFLSPAYTNVALGIDWVPNKWFNMNIAPLTGGFTICTTEALRATYGMPAVDGGGYRSALFQFGAQVKANFKVVVNDNFTYETQAVVFTDYLAEPYFRVNWDNAINWKVGKFITLAFKTWMIYDPLVTIDGEKRVQFKEFLSFNFSYTISSKK